MTTTRRLLIVSLAGLAASLALVAGRARPASASCVASVDYLGASYLARSTALAPSDVGRPAGRGSLPGCNDVVTEPPQPAEPATPVTVRRVRGVAPRLAVAGAGGRADDPLRPRRRDVLRPADDRRARVPSAADRRPRRRAVAHRPAERARRGRHQPDGPRPQLHAAATDRVRHRRADPATRCHRALAVPLPPPPPASGRDGPARAGGRRSRVRDGRHRLHRGPPSSGPPTGRRPRLVPARPRRQGWAATSAGSSPRSRSSDRDRPARRRGPRRPPLGGLRWRGRVGAACRRRPARRGRHASRGGEPGALLRGPRGRAARRRAHPAGPVHPSRPARPARPRHRPGRRKHGAAREHGADCAWPSPGTWRLHAARAAESGARDRPAKESGSRRASQEGQNSETEGAGQ